jgi:hypothetical protein
MLGIKVERTRIRGQFAKDIRECVRRAYLAEKAKRSSSAASSVEESSNHRQVCKQGMRVGLKLE